MTPTQHVRLRRKLGHVSRSPNYYSPASPIVPGDVSTPSGQFLEPNVDSISRKAVKRPRSPGLMDDASPGKFIGFSASVRLFKVINPFKCRMYLANGRQVEQLKV